MTFVGSAGATLRGTLSVPAGATGRSPAMVLLPGSGPTDRDDNVPPTLMDDLLKTVADRLARRGIATLRYDKRGMYANGGDRPHGLPAWTDFFGWDRFVGDATAAVTFLRNRPEVDPARVGMVGHSEGCLLALCATADLGKGGGQPPVALVLLAGPCRPLGVLIAEQLAASVRRQHATTRQARDVLDANQTISQSLARTGQLPAGGVPASLAALYPRYLTIFWHGALAVDPAALAGTYAGPVLVVNGTADEQVSADRDAKALDVALGRRTHDSHELLLVPGCSHFLKPTSGPGANGVTGDVPPATMSAVVDWAASHL